MKFEQLSVVDQCLDDHLLVLLHLDKLSPCCCACGLYPGEQLSVYDPDLDKRFIMKDGEVVEDPEDHVEDPNEDDPDEKETETKEERDVEIGGETKFELEVLDKQLQTPGIA